MNLDQILEEKGKQNCFISEITVFELRFGAENSQNIERSHKAIDLFVNGISIIPLDITINEIN